MSQRSIVDYDLMNQGTCYKFWWWNCHSNDKILGGARIVESQFKFEDLFDGSNI